MKSSTCNATFVTLVTGQTMVSPRTCMGHECKLFPCPHAERWAKRHGMTKADLKGQTNF